MYRKSKKLYNLHEISSFMMGVHVIEKSRSVKTSKDGQVKKCMYHILKVRIVYFKQGELERNNQEI